MAYGQCVSYCGKQLQLVNNKRRPANITHSRYYCGQRNVVDSDLIVLRDCNIAAIVCCDRRRHSQQARSKVSVIVITIAAD